MRSHLFPTFTMDAENFERALSVITNLTEELHLSCSYWRQGPWYAISFKDQAINHGIYYTAKHEQKMINALTKEVEFDLVYVAEDTFNNGKSIS